jgi:hypothetical protein
MKTITSANFWVVLMLCTVSLSSCETSSIEQLNKVKKPAIVYSKHKERAWYESSSMVLKDANGKLIVLNKDAELESLIDKYNVGDTLK